MVIPLLTKTLIIFLKIGRIYSYLLCNLLRGFNFIETVYELFDNPHIQILNVCMIYSKKISFSDGNSKHRYFY